MADTDFYRQIQLFIRQSGDAQMLEFLPGIQVLSDRPRTLIVSLELDNMEMIESARLLLQTGDNRITFGPAVRIHHPLLWQPAGCGTQSFYNLTLKFYDHGEIFHLEDRVSFRFAEHRNGRLHINGREYPRELVIHDDSRTDLERILFEMDDQGIPVGIRLTGEPLPGFFSRHPSICLLKGKRPENLPEGIPFAE